jgi:hypothetical protein
VALTPWKPGQSGNPNGRPSLPKEIVAERRKNQAALIKLVILYFGMTAEESSQRLAGPEANQLEEAVQGVIGRAKEGDTTAFKYLTEIICGKIPEIDAEDRTEDMTPQQKLEAMEKATALLKAQIAENGSKAD